MFLSWPYILASMLLAIVVGLALSRRQQRRTAARFRDLAAALGFDVLEGRDAMVRMTPEAQQEAAAEALAKVPEGLMRVVERAMVGSTFCLVGAVDGVPITIYTYTRTGGRSNSTYTVVRGDYRQPLPFDLSITSEIGLTRLGKALFGLRDLEIGDEAFDRAARVKASDEVAARLRLEQPGARDAVLALLALPGLSSANNMCAQWEDLGYHLDPARSRDRVAAVAAVARTLGGS